MIKGSIDQEDIMIVNICPPNTREPKNIKQMFTDEKGEIESNIIIAGTSIPKFQQ